MMRKIGKIKINSSRTLRDMAYEINNESDHFDEELDVYYHKGIAKADLADGDGTQDEIEGWLYDEDYDGEDFDFEEGYTTQELRRRLGLK